MDQYNSNVCGFNPVEPVAEAKATVEPPAAPKKRGRPPKAQTQPTEPAHQAESNANKAGPTPEEIAEARRTLLMQIAEYHNSSRFGEFLKERGFKATPTQLTKMEHAPLIVYYSQVKFAVQSKSSAIFVNQLADKAVELLERAVSTRVDITGTARILKQNDAALDAIEQWRIENPQYFNMGPFKRFMLIFSMTAYQASQINAIMGGQNPPTEIIEDEVDEN